MFIKSFKTLVKRISRHLKCQTIIMKMFTMPFKLLTFVCDKFIK